jgi:peptide/nickel transport system substrate-binding protein
VFVNTLQSAKSTPWLATSWKYSDGNKTLTFNIRNGVKWSDGKPMTAADVVFSFNLLKKFKALDVNSVWSVLSGVTQQGSKVVMTFKAPAVTYFYYIADQIDRAAAHLVDRRRPGEVPGHAPGGHRRIHGEPLHATEHHLQGQPALLAAR